MLLTSTLYRSIRGKIMTILLGMLLIMLPLAGCDQPVDPFQPTPIDLGIPTAALNSPIVGPLPADTVLHARITFKINPDWLKKAEQEPLKPGTPSHLESFANKLGIDDATYQKIKSWFSVQGIALKLSKLRTHLSVDAKASTLAKLFQTNFVIHKYNDRTFFAPATPPKVPHFMASSIDAITGLTNYSAPPVHMLHFLKPAQPQQPAQDCAVQGEQILLPRDVAGAYGYDALWNRGWHGENMTVNLVEIDGAYRDDIQNYLDCIQFAGHFSVVNVDGAPQDALGESTLDVQMVAGLARAANIKVYQTDGNTDGDIWAQVNDELQAILDDNVNNANAGSVVSISLGTAEQEIDTSDLRAIDSTLQQLTRAEHMTVFVASGDCGAFSSRVYGQLAVSFPASDPWVASVGGTMLSVDSNRKRAEEIGWSDGSQRSQCKNQWGSGGGNSVVFQRPSWQSAWGVDNQHSKGARQLPDISAVAYGLAVYFKGQWGVVGGTSAAAPIWATGTVLANQGLIQQKHTFAYSPQLFYMIANQKGNAQPYYDVTRGNNLYYQAGPGWDFVTGLGTPNLDSFYQVLSSLRPQNS